MHAVNLSLATLGTRSFLLHDLTGKTELLAEPDDPQSVIRLLTRLLHDADGGPSDLASLPVSWRDRILAAIFIREFGADMRCQGACTSCTASFEFSIALPEIMDAQSAQAAQLGMALDDDGHWHLSGGAKIRPPTLADIAAVQDPKALRASLKSGGKIPAAKLEEFLEKAAPLISIDLAATCPECETAQTIHFEIGAYLIESLAAERAFLLRETHLVASRYGWNHGEIMELPRRDRRAFAAMIESERSQALGRRAS